MLAWTFQCAVKGLLILAGANPAVVYNYFADNSDGISTGYNGPLSPPCQGAMP